MKLLAQKQLLFIIMYSRAEVIFTQDCKFCLIKHVIISNILVFATSQPTLLNEKQIHKTMQIMLMKKYLYLLRCMSVDLLSFYEYNLVFVFVLKQSKSRCAKYFSRYISR